jgi:hypothetical protein
MATLDDVLIFTKVAQFESISRAARSLSVPISTVSRRVGSDYRLALLRRARPVRQVRIRGYNGGSGKYFGPLLSGSRRSSP